MIDLKSKIVTLKSSTFCAIVALTANISVICDDLSVSKMSVFRVFQGCDSSPVIGW